MEGKRGIGKPNIMMLDGIKTDETYQKIKRRAIDRECWINWMPRTCFQAEHQWWWCKILLKMIFSNKSLLSILNVLAD